MHSDSLDVGWFEKIGGLEVSWLYLFGAKERVETGKEKRK
jgi:hypothetical protein